MVYSPGFVSLFEQFKKIIFVIDACGITSAVPPAEIRILTENPFEKKIFHACKYHNPQ